MLVIEELKNPYWSSRHDNDFEEHWVYCNENYFLQLQGINCKNCGEYKCSSKLLIIPSKIICKC